MKDIAADQQAHFPTRVLRMSIRGSYTAVPCLQTVSRIRFQAKTPSTQVYAYYHAAYIEKVRVLNAYGSTDGQLPDYIKQKNWSSPNPFMTGSTVRLCENGGCGFNHSMSLGTVSFATSLMDLP